MRNLKVSQGVYLVVSLRMLQQTKMLISERLSRVFGGLYRIVDEFPLGVSFVFYTMQLREKMDRNSWSLSAKLGKTAVGKNLVNRIFLHPLGYLAVRFPVFNGISRMNSRVEKAKIDLTCTHCSRRIKWAWLIQYHSFQYTQLVYVCSECEQVIRIENAPKTPKRSPILSDPALQRKK